MPRLVLVLLLLLAASPAGAEPVGSVVRLQGRATAIAAGVSRDLAPNSPIERGDTLHTGDRARLGVRFADGTEMILGEDAVLVVERYAFDPAGHGGEASFSVERGPFLLDSGAIAKLPGRPLHIKTPLAVIGLRGTKFWGGPLDEPFGVLLFDGAITVANAAGAVDLITPRVGTSLFRPDQAPSQPLQWSEERVRRAVATVSFER